MMTRTDNTLAPCAANKAIPPTLAPISKCEWVLKAHAAILEVVKGFVEPVEYERYSKNYGEVLFFLDQYTVVCVGRNRFRLRNMDREVVGVLSLAGLQKMALDNL